MGFGVENVLIRGRPVPAELEAWVQAALPRLRRPELQLPDEDRPHFLTVDVAVHASVRLETASPEDFTILWLATSSAAAAEPAQSLMSFSPLLRLFGIKKSDPLDWKPLSERATLPPLPEDRVGADATQRNPFLLSLALIAKSEGRDSAFFADGSVSDSGCLFVPGGDAVAWSAANCGAQRKRADEVLRATFSAEGPELDELQWVGPGAPFWSRPLVVAGRRLDGSPLAPR